MAGFLELHVLSSGSPITLAEDALTRVSVNYNAEDSAIIHLLDGGSLEVRESYGEIRALLGLLPSSRSVRA